MAVSEAQKRAKDKWDSNNTKVARVRLMIKSDSDILDFWEKLPNKAEVFRIAMREYMENHPIKE